MVRSAFQCSVLLLMGTLLSGCHGSVTPGIEAPGERPVNGADLARQENDRGFQLIQEGKPAEADAILHRAIEADGAFGPAHNNLGVAFYQTDRLYPAALELQKAIRLMPRQAEPRNNLGLVYEKAGKLDDAAEAYAKARELAPGNPEFVGNLARVRVRRGDADDETLKLLEAVVANDSRAEWRHWARMALFRLRSDSVEPAPATQRVK